MINLPPAAVTAMTAAHLAHLHEYMTVTVPRLIRCPCCGAFLLRVVLWNDPMDADEIRVALRALAANPLARGVPLYLAVTGSGDDQNEVWSVRDWGRAATGTPAECLAAMLGGQERDDGD